MSDRPKLKGLSSTFDIPDPDEPAGDADEHLEPPPGVVVPASVWFATVWCAIALAGLGVAALWLLAVTEVAR